MLKLFIDQKEIEVKQWLFPAKEVGVKIAKERVPIFVGEVVVKVVWEGNDDLFALAQVVDALRNSFGIKDIVLEIPYFPYSRQDRRCFLGEGHALKVVVDFINSLHFSEVVTKDAHSYVLEALVNNLTAIPQEVCARDLPIFDAIVAPDQGAAKKIYNNFLVKNHNVPVVVASKKRDSNGKIVETTVDSVSYTSEQHVCVVDDLCDGGATFIELAKALRDKGVCYMSLYVTHGIFSKGVDTLLQFYDNIYVSNLMNQSVKQFVKEI